MVTMTVGIVLIAAGLILAGAVLLFIVKGNPEERE